MQKMSRTKFVDLNLVEEKLAEDKANRSLHKKKWKRRWLFCCCSIWFVITATVVVAILVLAIAPWSLLNEECEWEPRSFFGAVYTAQGRIVVAGGMAAIANFGDVWDSDRDGQQWRLLTSSAAFGPRHGHALVTNPATGALFVIAGMAGETRATSTLRRDVWRSIDGKEWTQQTSSAPWPARKLLGAVVDIEGRLLIVGGQSGYREAALNDVWASKDEGKTWQALALAAPWSARHSFGMAQLPGGTRSGRLYVLGGSDGRKQHDVWASDDAGTTWQLMTFTHTREMRASFSEERASWTPRVNAAAAADANGVLTLTGGLIDGQGEETLSNEVWQLPSPAGDQVAWYERKSSDDRLNTVQAPLEWKLQSTPPWTARRGHQLIIDEEGIPHMLGGQDANGMKNDLWRMKSSLDFRNLQLAYERMRSQATGIGVDDSTDVAA